MGVKKYEKPFIEVIRFETEDIIACSGEPGNSNNGNHYGWEKGNHYGHEK